MSNLKLLDIWLILFQLAHDKESRCSAILESLIISGFCHWNSTALFFRRTLNKKQSRKKDLKIVIPHLWTVWKLRYRSQSWIANYCTLYFGNLENSKIFVFGNVRELEEDCTLELLKENLGKIKRDLNYFNKRFL